MRSNNHTALVRLCGRMKFLTRACQSALVLGLLVLAFAAASNLEKFAIWIGEFLDLSRQPALTPTTAMALVVVAAAIAALGFFGLQTVWTLFHRLQKDDPLSFQVAALLRRAGMFALASAVAAVVIPPVATLLATVNNPPGSRLVSVSFGSDQLMLMLVAGLLLVMGHVMVLATAVKEDYERFI